MSAQTETIEITGLPEGTREAIRELSQSKGKSAEEYLRTLIEAELLSLKPNARVRVTIETGGTAHISGEASPRRLSELFGSVDLGHPTGADNESIDADLAREYASTHEEAH